MNPVRQCLYCLGTDDHPRHSSLVGETWIDPHLDCCAVARNCEHCKAQLEGVGGVEGNPKGEELRAHLMTTSTAADMPGWTAPTGEEG